MPLSFKATSFTMKESLKIMSKDYYITYHPSTYNLMDISCNNGLSPYFLISYLTNLNGFDLSEDNFIDYLEFDKKKQRASMMDTFAIQNYGTLYIANQISRFAPESRVIQSNDRQRSIRDIIIRQGKRPKAVFVTAISANFPCSALMSIILNFGKIPVIIGGIHVSSNLEDVDVFIRKYAPYPELVSQVIGAGDSKVVAQILQDLDNDTLRSEYEGFKIIEDNVWAPRDNIDYLPPVRLHALERIPVLGKFLSKKMRIILTAPFLGCPYSCKFCSISSLPKNQRKFTIRSTEDFLNELQSHQKRDIFELRFFFFMPDNLLLGRESLEPILDGIIERRLQVNFATQITIDVASNERLLKKLRRAGATHFFIGFESLDIRNLEHIGKHFVKDIQKSGLSVTQYYAEQIKKIQNHGISIHGAFIFGLPYDYFDSFESNTARDIIKFCASNHIGLQPTCLNDLPGSRFFRESQASNTWLYGKQGTMEYFLALCLADCLEINSQPPDSLGNSPLTVFYIFFESLRVCTTTQALINAMYMMKKSFAHPTYRGRESLKERVMDSIFSSAIQLYFSLYKEVGEKLAHSAYGVRGAFERLYEIEKNSVIRDYFNNFVERYK
jgi:radical SAM superfamily enzyme YgiQ (UPF0313 family)